LRTPLSRNPLGHDVLVSVRASALHALELHHDHQADDHQQHPRRQLVQTRDPPTILLARLLPRTQERRDVLGEPHEDLNEQEQ
jgi:hypothetical protein